MARREVARVASSVPVRDPELGVDVRQVRLDGAGGWPAARAAAPTGVGDRLEAVGPPDRMRVADAGQSRSGWALLPCDSRLGTGEFENQVS